MGINLANQTGREGKLSAAYAAAARDYTTAGGTGFRLEPFDFHKQCGATNYARLGLLWEVRPARRVLTNSCATAEQSDLHLRCLRP